METWPTLLPNPTQRYASSSDPRLSVTEFDRNFRQRQRYSSNEEILQVSWRFNQFEYDYFRAFVERTLLMGSLEFDVNLIGLDGIERRVVRIQAGKTSMQYVSDGWYDITSVLIGKPATSMDAGTYEFLATLETSEIAGFARACDVLSLYIEEHFGESSGSAEITSFLASYS